MFRMFAGLGTTALLLIIIGSWLALSVAAHTVSYRPLPERCGAHPAQRQAACLPKVRLHEAEAVGHAIVQASHLMAKLHYRAYHNP